MTARIGDLICFVFDNERVKEESDFIADGILYFSPCGTEKSEQHGLLGQLIGINRFLQMTFGSPASVYSLRDMKIALRHIGRYTVGLSGKLNCSNDLLLQQLDRLLNIFQFYRGGFTNLEKVCNALGNDFNEALQRAWDCFTAFVKRYGDSIASNFQSLPFVKLPEEIELEVYLRSAHLVHEVCDIIEGAKAGCLLYDSRICYTQMTPEMTSRFIVIRPKQQNLPCQQLPSDLELQGVRLFKVYLSPQDLHSLNPHRKQLSDSKTSASTTKRLSDLSINEPKSCNHTLNGVTPLDVEGDQSDQQNSIVGESADGASQDKMDALDSSENKPLENESSAETTEELVEMEMFVQGSSDSVFVLIMDNGSLSDTNVLKKTWKHVLMCIAEIEGLIHRTTSISPTPAEPDSDSDFRYLTYSNVCEDLTGTVLQPVTLPEHNFCQAAQVMHADFQADTETREITLRTQKSLFIGLRDGYDEFFCWPTNYPVKPGIPSSKSDPNTKQLIENLKRVKLKSK